MIGPVVSEEVFEYCGQVQQHKTGHGYTVSSGELKTGPIICPASMSLSSNCPGNFKHLKGAGCSKLTLLLVNNSLKFQMTILQIHCHFFNKK